MEKLPLMSGAYKKPQQNYNEQMLTSYAGYPVVSAKSLGLEDYFNTGGKQVAGMAWGGKTNPPGQGGPQKPGDPYDDVSIVPNQNYFKNDPSAYNALVKLEASRHWMGENDYIPKFEITPEMQEWRKKNFANVGPAGEAYLNDDNAFRQTVISRQIGGDRNVPPLTSKALKEVGYVDKKLKDLNNAVKKQEVDRMFRKPVIGQKRGMMRSAAR
jgi:hypothetical protein